MSDTTTAIGSFGGVTVSLEYDSVSLAMSHLIVQNQSTSPFQAQFTNLDTGIITQIVAAPGTTETREVVGTYAPGHYLVTTPGGADPDLTLSAGSNDEFLGP